MNRDDPSDSDTDRRTQDPTSEVNPDPSQTPGLEPGGSVRPGDTPPESPQTSGLSHQEAPMAQRFPYTGRLALVAVALIVIVFILVAIFVVW
ncbi:DUF6480 family protein [Gordonia sp. DT30]|uniref:DUF6480 family protein n=1 Tax=unclassified Gordonia (in: high G+C Gram-positive bacteria) TaxID=2657482 RepID=UPI003CED99E2